MNDEVKHTPIPLPLSVGEARNWRGENMGRGDEILDATGMTVGNALAHARPYIVEAVNNYDRLREVNADLLAALEALMPMGEALLRVGRSFRDRQPWMEAQEKEGELSLLHARAAIARARGENVNA